MILLSHQVNLINKDHPPCKMAMKFPFMLRKYKKFLFRNCREFAFAYNWTFLWINDDYIKHFSWKTLSPPHHRKEHCSFFGTTSMHLIYISYTRIVEDLLPLCIRNFPWISCLHQAFSIIDKKSLLFFFGTEEVIIGSDFFFFVDFSI